MSGTAGSSEAQKQHSRLVLLIVGAGVLILLVLAAAVLYLIGATSHTPQKAVDAYLRALIHGDATTALRLGGIEPKASDHLLTDKAYDASVLHIDGFATRSVVVNGASATVTVKISQSGAKYTSAFAVVLSGKDFLLFDRWKLKPVTLGTVTVTLQAPPDAVVDVGGTRVPHASGHVDERVLPGSYHVSIEASAALTSAAKRVDVYGFGSKASQPATLAAYLNAAGQKAATDAVNRYIDTCISSKELQPAGCTFGVTDPVPGDTYSNVQWDYSRRPQFSVDGWYGSGWVVRVTVIGYADFSTDLTDSSGALWQAWLKGVGVDVSGVVTADDGSSATFSPDGLSTVPSLATA